MRAVNATPPALLFAQLDGADPKVAGMSARARNLRVAARLHADVVAPEELLAHGDRPTLLLPAACTVQVGIVPALPAPSEPVRVMSAPEGPAAWWGPAAALGRLLADEMAPDGIHTVPPGVLFDLRTPALALIATKALVRQAEKPTDGWVSRHFNRPLSRTFSVPFLRMGLSPNHASVMNLVIGLGSAWFAAQTGYWTMALAGFLFHLASAFDGVDGEMARATLGESKLGAWVDTAVDNSTYLACLIGVTIGWMREGIGLPEMVLAGVAVAGVPAVLLIFSVLVRRYGPDGSFVFVDRTVERAAKDTGRRSLALARLLFYALRRDLFAAIFFLISLTGTRAAVPATIAGGLLVAVLTMAFHWPRLVDAAKALQAEAAAR
jgi:CDP-L-myo-inositol myo-inositolphosphotransferase